MTSYRRSAIGDAYLSTVELRHRLTDGINVKIW